MTTTNQAVSATKPGVFGDWTPFAYGRAAGEREHNVGQFSTLEDANAEIGALRDHIVGLIEKAGPGAHNLPKPKGAGPWGPLVRGVEYGAYRHEIGRLGGYYSLPAANQEVGFLRDHIMDLNDLITNNTPEVLRAQIQRLEVELEDARKTAVRSYQDGVKDGRQQLADQLNKLADRQDELLENPNAVGGTRVFMHGGALTSAGAELG